MFGSGRGVRLVGERLVGERIGFELYQSCRNKVSVGRVSMFRLWWCGREECVGGLVQCGGMYVCVL